VTPILVRPVREQLEHDRVIRLLQQRWRRKYVVGINQGSETTASMVHGDTVLYPDVVLAPLGKPNKPEIVVEVETGESVNNLEAMAEWIKLGATRAEFHLYVPTGSVDSARRLCTEHKIPVAEIWTFYPVGDQMRFNLVYKAPPQTRAAKRAAAVAARPTVKAPAKPPVKTAPAHPTAGNGSVRKAAPTRRAAKPAPKAAVKRVEARKAAKPARVQKRK
jgi:hypothetical protein